MLEKPTVLMLSTDPRVLGGMTTMANMIMQHATQTKFNFIPVGSIKDQAGGGRRESFFACIWRLMAAPFDIAHAAKKAKLVHLNTPFVAKGLLRDGLILLALRLTGHKKILLYFHGFEPHVANALRNTSLLRRLFLWLLPQHILVLAPDFKNALIEIGVPAQHIAITRTMFDGHELRENVMSIANGRRRILYMSRFVREKGVYELLDAFIKLAPHYPDTDLILAGDGPEYTGLRAAAAKHPELSARIQFPGYVQGAEKAALLHTCDIFALPTYFPEGMPVALLEAMGAGKPLLTAKAGGIAEVISQPQNGIVLDTVTADSIATALQQLLDNPDVCHAIGAYNKTYAWEHFEAGAVTKEIETYYQKIAAA